MINIPKTAITPLANHPIALGLIGSTFPISVWRLGILITILFLTTTALSFGLWQLNPLISAENALIELCQFLLLFVAALVQGMRAYQTRSHLFMFDIRLALALFVFALCLREIDIDKIGPQEAWANLEIILRSTTLICLVVIGVRIFSKFKDILRNSIWIRLSPTFILLVLGCLFYLFSWPFDKYVFDIDKKLSIWIEETIEINACILICLSGFVVRNDHKELIR